MRILLITAEQLQSYALDLTIYYMTMITPRLDLPIVVVRPQLCNFPHCVAYGPVVETLLAWQWTCDRK